MAKPKVKTFDKVSNDRAIQILNWIEQTVETFTKSEMMLRWGMCDSAARRYIRILRKYKRIHIVDYLSDTQGRRVIPKYARGGGVDAVRPARIHNTILARAYRSRKAIANGNVVIEADMKRTRKQELRQATYTPKTVWVGSGPL